MKLKLLILGGFIACACHVNAQTEKGKQLIGGSIGFLSMQSGQGPSNVQQNTVSFGPKYGYFVANNLAIGLDGSYEFNKMTSSYKQITAVNGTYHEQTIENLNKAHTTSIGVFARQYVDLSEKFKFFGQFNASIGFGKDEQSNRTPVIMNSTVYNVSVSPSIAFFPVKNLAVELGFGLFSYFNSKYKYENSPNNIDSRTEGFTFGFNTFQPKLGVNFHL
jgi:hypothetical protein